MGYLRMHSFRQLGLLLGFTVALASPAFAQEPTPGASCAGFTAGQSAKSGGPEVSGGGHFVVCDGSNWVSFFDYRDEGKSLFQVDYDSGSCTSAKDGRIRYSSSGSPKWEYCDGGTTSWLPFESAASGGGCSPPDGCSDIGDVCADGSLFAGFMAGDDGACRIIYVTDDNQDPGAEWKTSTGTDDISTDSDVDGRINHANRSGSLTDYPAFEICESNTYHGKSDWYLPAVQESILLWINRLAINANAGGSFYDGHYWTSTELNDWEPWRKDFSSSGELSYTDKDNSFGVRCIRSELSGAGGCTAPTLCPNIGDVCDDSNAGTTNDPIFAGFMVYNDPNSEDYGRCKPLYVTNNNQSTSSQWKTSDDADDVTTDSESDGQIIDGQIANSTTFPAFKLCKDLTDGGFNDWYLPSRGELYLVWQNYSAIDANAAAAFTGSDYWTSTECDGTDIPAVDACTIDMDYHGEQIDQNKSEVNGVRCVRRD